MSNKLAGCGPSLTFRSSCYSSQSPVDQNSQVAINPEAADSPIAGEFVLDRATPIHRFASDVPQVSPSALGFRIHSMQALSTSFGWMRRIGHTVQLHQFRGSPERNPFVWPQDGRSVSGEIHDDRISRTSSLNVVPLDKREGSVKDKDILGSAKHRLLCQRG